MNEKKKLVNFSDKNRELSQQIDPQTGERVQLITRKQLQKLRKKNLKEMKEF